MQELLGVKMAQFEMTIYAYWSVDQYHDCHEEFVALKTDMEEVAEEMDDLIVAKESAQKEEDQQLAFLME